MAIVVKGMGKCVSFGVVVGKFVGQKAINGVKSVSGFVQKNNIPVISDTAKLGIVAGVAYFSDNTQLASYCLVTLISMLAGRVFQAKRCDISDIINQDARKARVEAMTQTAVFDLERKLEAAEHRVKYAEDTLEDFKQNVLGPLAKRTRKAEAQLTLCIGSPTETQNPTQATPETEKIYAAFNELTQAESAAFNALPLEQKEKFLAELATLACQRYNVAQLTQVIRDAIK